MTDDLAVSSESARLPLEVISPFSSTAINLLFHTSKGLEGSYDMYHMQKNLYGEHDQMPYMNHQVLEYQMIGHRCFESLHQSAFNLKYYYWLVHDQLNIPTNWEPFIDESVGNDS